ncbi:TetR/AcrR family transcriptional regulator [Vibrio agarivorans]|uniref:TetR/AcrR family transcriptional regulator n=1 Tax=Vibrio agarivorans TaxID=153622 RepID=A0ABT7XZJ7_9VIBR|nr:TetR/AcrR family transcriptional regulator [Vibrio agarivorans]
MVRKGRRSVAESLKTRSTVIAAVEAIIIEEGVSKLNTRYIADKANVSFSLIRHHFGHMPGLLDEVVGKAEAQLTELIHEAKANYLASNTGSVDQFLSACFEGLSNNVSICILLDALCFSSYIGEKQQEMAIVDRLRTQLLELILNEDNLRGHDVNELVFLFISMLRGISFSSHYNQQMTKRGASALSMVTKPSSRAVHLEIE